MIVDQKVLSYWNIKISELDFSIGYDVSSSGGAKCVSNRLDVILNISGVEYGRDVSVFVFSHHDFQLFS